MESGVNFFFFYSPGQKRFVDALLPLARKQRDELILASGSGARKPGSLRAARRKILAAVAADVLDIFFAEYINPGDDADAIFGRRGLLDELQRWKAEGAIRFVGATAHDRGLAQRLAADPRVDILMHRYNMAHRKATAAVFPAAIEAQTPVVAFTATRWGSLLKPHPRWQGPPPRAADCYRFCLAQPAVEVVLTAPQSVAECEENMAVLGLPPMGHEARCHWERYGDLIYNDGVRGADEFESLWP